MSGPRPVGGVRSLARHEDYRKAVSCLERRDLRGAESAATAVLRKFPRHADAHALGAAIAAAKKRYSAALRCIDNALKLAPDNAGYLAHRSFALAQMMRYCEAAGTARQALALKPRDADVLATIGSALTQCGNYEDALDSFQRAADIATASPVHQYNLGTALRFAGRFAEAERCFNRSIALRPEDCEAYYARSGLRTQTPDNNHVAELERLAALPERSWRDRSLILYALAKELEDLGEWERSFESLQQGASLRRSHTRYDVSGDEEKMRQIAAAFPVDSFDGQRDGADSDEPVFIVGLPRAGSTLVDRILASHEAVISAGELQVFAVELMRLAHRQAGSSRLSFDRLLDISRLVDHRELGEAYVAGTRHRTGNSRHFTDKMPLNFLYLGLIAKALPNAKIVHVWRHPLDACYAMYKTVFKGAYPFSYDLADLARYYGAYNDLMQHWNVCLPGRILNLQYEDMVLQQEKTTRTLLKFCDLEWQAQCLEFHRLTDPATTASAVEVRRPIYQSSIGKWKNYRRQLEPLVQMLKERGVPLQET